MQAVSAIKNRWGFTYKPFFDGTDLAIHNANLSKAGRTFFDFILTKLDGKRRNLMTIPFSDTEFAQRFNYSESRARHARLEVVDAKLAEQHYGRTKSGHRIVGKFCFKLVLPNTNDTPLNSPSSPITPPSPSESPAQQTQQSPPNEPPVSAKVAESQPEKWLEVSHKSGQGLATFSAAESYSKPVIARFASDDVRVAIDVPIDVCINVPPPISPSNIEKLSLAWNESHEYEEGEEEAFDKYFDKAIRATMDQYAVDENVATAALARAFHRTKRNHAGHHPYDYPTAYTGDPDHEESKATPRGKKILQGAVHAVKSGESFIHKQPSSPSNDSTITEKPTAETMERQCPDKGSAAPTPAEPTQPARPKQAEPQTPIELVRRNLAGRAAMLKAGIISPLSRDDVLSHAQPGLDAFDDIPSDDVIVGVWNELVPTPAEGFKASDALNRSAESEDTQRKPTATTEPIDPPKPDAFMELAEIQAKIAGLDEMRRSGTLSVDEVAEVTQEIAALKRQKAKVQRDADKCSASVDQDTDKGVYDAAGATGESVEGLRLGGQTPRSSTIDETLSRRIAKTIKSSLMADKEYSDEQIVLIVQRQERSIDQAAILEVWHNWSDWSAYVKDFVDQRIQSGSLMPDEVLEARSYAARLRDWERKNEQFQAVV